MFLRQDESWRRGGRERTLFRQDESWRRGEESERSDARLLRYDVALSAVDRGHHVMVVVHSRK